MTLKAPIIIFLSVFLTIQFSDGNILTETKAPFTAALKIHNDTFRPSAFKFPKDRPYHYANSAHDIPHNFLPVHTTNLPKGDGVWVLRYKDFSGPPETFVQEKSIDHSRSVITFKSIASAFTSVVTIKALAFGDVQLDLALEGDRRKNPDNLFETMAVTDRISLFGQNSPQNCTSTGSKADQEKNLKWTVFEVETAFITHFKLEAKIGHPKSFLLLDEIIVQPHDCEINGSKDYDGMIACKEETKSRKNRLSGCKEVN